MNDVRKDVITWLNEQQHWLQVAAEKILRNEPISDEVIAELTTLLKSDDPDIQKNTVDFSFFNSHQENNTEIILDSIGDINGIDNLAPRSPLEFGPKLNAIYGNNGSGKSGYARIVKKACGKPNAVDLKSNVFAPLPAEQNCRIVYKVDGNEKSVKWDAKGKYIGELSGVDIFDGSSNQFYLEGETEVSYAPVELALFEALADARGVCKKVEALLNREKSQLVSHIPKNYPPKFNGTKYIRAMYDRLKPDIDVAKIKSFYFMTSDDEKEIKNLEQRLKVDPSALAKQKNQYVRQIQNLIKTTEDAAKLISPNSCNKLFELAGLANAARKIATEGAKAVAKGARLPGLGEDTWRALWEAAREYSANEVYQADVYPKTEDDALCVLCQQTLNDDAKQRLLSFENFVQGKLESDAAAAKNNLTTALARLPEVLSQEQIQTTIQAAQLDENIWLPVFSEIWKSIDVAIAQIKQRPMPNIDGLVLDDEVFLSLTQLVGALEKEIDQHGKDALDVDKEALEKELLNLEAKKWCFSYAEAITQEVERLGQLSTYDFWIAQTKTVKISNKAAKISVQVLTGAYIDRFKQELKALGASKIKVALVKSKTQQGKVKHKIRLDGAHITHQNKNAGEILSDGEQRVISLAAFLADVTGKPFCTPFVFDDPISSLDLDFEWDVSKRLVELARTRQVLVFTHRLSLFGSLEDNAKKTWGDKDRKKSFRQVCIETFNGVSGQVAPLDNYTAKPKAANNKLIDSLQKASAENQKNHNNDLFKLQLQGTCSEFRKLLERTVEYDLLGSIVLRHRRSITTDGRLSELPKISKEDCEFIDTLMTKYSCYEHSQSREAPTFLPDSAELLADLKSLKNWRTEFQSRGA